MQGRRLVQVSDHDIAFIAYDVGMIASDEIVKATATIWVTDLGMRKGSSTISFSTSLLYNGYARF